MTTTIKSMWVSAWTLLSVFAWLTKEWSSSRGIIFLKDCNLRTGLPNLLELHRNFCHWGAARPRCYTSMAWTGSADPWSCPCEGSNWDSCRMEPVLDGWTLLISASFQSCLNLLCSFCAQATAPTSPRASSMVLQALGFSTSNCRCLIFDKLWASWFKVQLAATCNPEASATTARLFHGLTWKECFGVQCHWLRDPETSKWSGRKWRSVHLDESPSKLSRWSPVADFPKNQKTKNRNK